MGTTLRKLVTVCSQFSILETVKVGLFEVARHILDPHAIITYSRNNEDRMVSYILPGTQFGFYVDVGCNHPKHLSNTMRLYRLGWHGICIDANGDFRRLFRHVRPRDTYVEAVVSSRVGEMEFLEFQDTCLSALSVEFQDGKQPMSAMTRRRRVAPRSLTSILDEYSVPARFDLLSVDCEGHDYEVLMSLDFKRYRPRLIIVEIHNLDLQRQDEDSTCRRLADVGYKLIGYSGENGYFLDIDKGVGTPSREAEGTR